MDRRLFLQGLAAVGLKASLAMSAPPAGREAFLEEQTRRRKELWGLLGDLPERRFYFSATFARDERRDAAAVAP